MAISLRANVRYPTVYRILAESGKPVFPEEYQGMENPHLVLQPFMVQKEEFEAGEVIDFDVISETPDMYEEIQFPDGDVAFNIPKKLLKKLKK